MDKQIITTLLIMAAVITFAMAFNAVYPAVMRSSDALVSAGRLSSEQLKTEIQIIHAAGELDATGLWRDTNSDGDMDVFIWAKNTGSMTVSAPASCDLFLGPEGSWERIPHQEHAEGRYPYWTYALEGTTRWEPTGTITITVHYPEAIASGRYYAKLVTANGRAAEFLFGM